MVDKQHGQRVRSRTAQALEMVEAGMRVSEAARRMGVKGPSIYRLIKYREAQAKKHADLDLALRGVQCGVCGAVVLAGAGVDVAVAIGATGDIGATGGNA